MRDINSIKRKLEEALDSCSGEEGRDSKEEKDRGQPAGSPSGEKPPSTASPHGDRYVLGRSPQTEKKVTVPADIGKHSLVLGVSGSGKSTFLLSQMLQDVHRGHSVILIDPHGGIGGLSHKFLSHIPKDRWEDVVYINPLTAFDHSKIVKINFLQPRRLRRDIVREMFIDSLRRTYPKFWGPRLENILTHALMLLYDAEEKPTIKELTDVIPNRKGKRSDLLDDCTDDEINNFWNVDYKAMDPQSYTSVMNKIYKMMTASPMREFARARDSTVDLYKKINEGSIVVVEIPKGKMTENISAFFGSIFLARIAQLAMQREDIPEDERRPVHVYVDEAHTFITEIIQRNMQELRKFGVLLTACSQNLQRYSDSGSENVLPELADYTVAFRCGEDTAKRIGEKFSTRLARGNSEPWEPLTKLRDYEFYAAVPIGTSIEIKKVRTIDVGLGEQDRDEIIDYSLEAHGEMTKRLMKTEKKGDVRIGSPRLDPPEFFVLHYLDKKGWDRENNVRDYLRKFRGLSGGDVLNAISRLKHDHYLGKSVNLPKGGEKKAQWRNQYLWLLENGVEALYPEMKDLLIGKAKHISMMCQVMRDLRYRENEMVAPVLPKKNPNSGFTTKIDEVKVKGEGDEIYPDLMLYFDHSKTGWPGNKRAAVEVDTAPEKMRFKKHFRDNRDRIRVPTLIVVGSEDDRTVVGEGLEKENAEIVSELDRGSSPREVQIMVVDPKNVERPSTVEAEGDTDKRLYHQVKETCKVNGDMEGYRRLVSSPGEGEGPEGEGSTRTEGEKTESRGEGGEGKPSAIVPIVDRVDNFGKEGQTERLGKEIQKLKEEGCDIEHSKPGKFRVGWKVNGESRFRIFEGKVAEEIEKITLGEKGSPSLEKPKGKTKRSPPKIERGEDESKPGDQALDVEQTLREVEDLAMEGAPKDLKDNLIKLRESGCTINIEGSDRVKIGRERGGEKVTTVLRGEVAEAVSDAVFGKSGTPTPEDEESTKKEEAIGKPREEKEPEEGESVKPGGMSEQERRKWRNKTGKEKWSEIERIVDNLRNLKKEGSSAQDLSENLRELKERGSSIFIQSRGKYQYLLVSKSILGETKQESLGSLDEKWKEACQLAGVEL